jgi:hypothetical protein
MAIRGHRDPTIEDPFFQRGSTRTSSGGSMRRRSTVAPIAEPAFAGLRPRLVGWLGQVVGVDDVVLPLHECQHCEHRRLGLGVDRDEQDRGDLSRPAVLRRWMTIIGHAGGPGTVPGPRARG